MVEAPERIWATFEPHQSGKGHPHTYATATKTKGQEYVRADIAEDLSRQLAAERAEKEQQYEVAADDIETLRDQLAERDAELARKDTALRPFADIAGESWADENGWTDAACQKDRICDWFGPSAFLDARAALDSRDGRWPVPEGYALVPVEPTSEMVNAAPATYSPSFQAIWPKICADIYRAMLAAAPAI